MPTDMTGFAIIEVVRVVVLTVIVPLSPYSYDSDDSDGNDNHEVSFSVADVDEGISMNRIEDDFHGLFT